MSSSSNGNETSQMDSQNQDGNGTKMVTEMLNLDNSIAIWREAKLQEDMILIEHCLHFLDENICDYYDSKLGGFWSLDQAEIGELFTRDTLMVKYELHRWAEKQCKDAGIYDPTGPEKRAKLGPLINAIRFPLIRPSYFTNRIVPTGILTAEEVAAMFVHYFDDADAKAKQVFPMPFSAKLRAIPCPGRNFKLVQKNIISQ